jgi:hypothetical protein
MKKYTLKVEMELTPSQAEHWNSMLAFLKTCLSAGPKVARQDFQQPPKEFAEKILSLKPLQISEKQESLEGKLFESSDPSEFWVSPFSIKELLLREK